MLKIVEVRKSKGLTQAGLARKAGVNQSSMCRIELGKEPPYPFRAQRIAKAIGWAGDPMDLFKEVASDECINA